MDTMRFRNTRQLSRGLDNEVIIDSVVHAIGIVVSDFAGRPGSDLASTHGPTRAKLCATWSAFGEVYQDRSDPGRFQEEGEKSRRQPIPTDKVFGAYPWCHQSGCHRISCQRRMTTIGTMTVLSQRQSLPP